MTLRTRIAGAALLLAGLSIVIWPTLPDSAVETTLTPTQQKFLGKSKTATQRAAFERMRTGGFPANMRSRELAFAAQLPKQGAYTAKAGDVTYAQPWEAVGPFNAGGRTRALAFDLGYNGTSNQRLLAGGVSGGMFVSEDGGTSWTLTTGLADIASVTTVAQDPSNHDVWYYGTGEYFGSSAAGGGNSAQYGTGVFKSTNGGLSWTQLPGGFEGTSEFVFDDYLDFVWRIAVTSNGTVLAATYGGIMRSTDGGDSWAQVLTSFDDNGETQISDVFVAFDGTVYAAISRNGGTHVHGVFSSTDDGATWEYIQVPMLADDSYRMLLAGTGNALYLMSQMNETGEVSTDVQLLRMNTDTGVWTDTGFEQNVPETQDEGGINLQGGYNMVLAVMPGDAETLWVGGTNLIRSRDGGQTWEQVGGYDPTGQTEDGTWDNHFSDQHILAFSPIAPAAMLSGHDGGISYTTNNLESPQTWTSLNNGYVVSQFYSMAIVPDVDGDERMLGGMQDQDSYYRPDGTGPTGDWRYVTLGADGADAAIASGGMPLYISAQNGNVVRVDNLDPMEGTLVKPAGFDDGDFLFVTPYVLDPNNTEVMYMAVGSGVARNSGLLAIPSGGQEPTDVNWTFLDASAMDPGGIVTAVAVSTEPAGRLFFAGTDFDNFDLRIMRVDDPASNDAGVDITPPLMDRDAYVSYIAVNPADADELMVTASNYETRSIWHTADGGLTWTDVEGNLGGDAGPSVRSAVIIPGGGYMVSTSVGVFGTTTLDGASTVWEQQGADVIGNAVVDELAFRASDGFLAAGSHGRGAFAAYVSMGSGVATEAGGELPSGVVLEPNYPNPFNPSTTLAFELAASSSVRLDVFDTAGRMVRSLDAGTRSAGRHEVLFDAGGLASGTYMARLTVLDDRGVPLRSFVQSMVLLK